MKRDAVAEAADLRLSASGRNGHSQQVNSPTITTTTTDVCGSTSDPVKGGEKERGIQNDGEFNLEDEENLKSKGTVPVINGSAGSKDSLQDQTDQNDTNISNYDETTGHDQRDDNYITKGDELKEADHVVTQNKRVPFWRKLIANRPWKSKRSSSDLERKGICGDPCCCFRVKAKPGQKKYGGGGGCSRADFGGGGGGGGGGGDGGGNGGGGDYGRFEPNPGIKRPTVTVSRPPPPPPPPPPTL